MDRALPPCLQLAHRGARRDTSPAFCCHQREGSLPGLHGLWAVKEYLPPPPRASASDLGAHTAPRNWDLSSARLPSAAPGSALRLHLDLHTHDARKPQQGQPNCGIFIAGVQKSCHPHLFTQQCSPSWALPAPPATDRPSPPPHLFFPPHLILHHPSFQNKLPHTGQAHSGPESLMESPSSAPASISPGGKATKPNPAPRLPLALI